MTIVTRLLFALLLLASPLAVDGGGRVRCVGEGVGPPPDTLRVRHGTIGLDTLYAYRVIIWTGDTLGPVKPGPAGNIYFETRERAFPVRIEAVRE